jgi:hypothetical protein
MSPRHVISNSKTGETVTVDDKYIYLTVSQIAKAMGLKNPNDWE